MLTMAVFTTIKTSELLFGLNPIDFVDIPLFFSKCILFYFLTTNVHDYWSILRRDMDDSVWKLFVIPKEKNQPW